jgi:hypothetical protein
VASLPPRLDEKKTRPRELRATPQTASRSLLIFRNHETLSRTARSDCAQIATRNAPDGKIAAKLGNWRLQHRFQGDVAIALWSTKEARRPFGIWDLSQPGAEMA